MSYKQVKLKPISTITELHIAETFAVAGGSDVCQTFGTSTVSGGAFLAIGGGLGVVGGAVNLVARVCGFGVDLYHDGRYDVSVTGSTAHVSKHISAPPATMLGAAIMVSSSTLWGIGLWCLTTDSTK